MARKATEATPKKAAAKPRKGNGAKADAWRPRFLSALAESCNVTYAAREARVNRNTAYEHRDKDGDFAAAWDDAMEQGVEALEFEARRRALHGVEEPVVYLGKVIYTVKKYSDTLTIFLLKAHRPDVYRERQTIDHNVNGEPVIPAVFRPAKAGEEPPA